MNKFEFEKLIKEVKIDFFYSQDKGASIISTTLEKYANNSVFNDVLISLENAFIDTGKHKKQRVLATIEKLEAIRKFSKKSNHYREIIKFHLEELLASLAIEDIENGIEREF